MNDEAGIARARWRVERRATCMIEGREREGREGEREPSIREIREWGV